MSALVRNLRTIWDRFESETGKVGSTGGANTRDVFTSDPDPIEATASIGTPIPADLDTMIHQGTATDMSDTLIYGWFLTSPPLDSAFSQSSGGTRGPGFGIILSDDTEIRAFGLGGSNRAGFRHDADRPDWQAIVLDTYVAARVNIGSRRITNDPKFADADLRLLYAEAGNVTANQHNATTLGSPTYTSITELGYFVTRLAAVKGGVENTFCDIMRYGTEGIQVIEDTAGATSNFLDIAKADRSGAANAAHAAVRETGQKSYSINSRITIGDSAGGSQSVNFVETNSIIQWESYPLKKRFEGRVISEFDSNEVPRFRIITSGPSTGGTTGFKIGTRTGDGTGSSGCVFTAPEVVDVDFKLDDANVDSVGVYGSTFRNIDSILFSKSKTTSHEAFQNDFIGCGPIFSNIDYRNNSHFNTGQRLNLRGNRLQFAKEETGLLYGPHDFLALYDSGSFSSENWFARPLEYIGYDVGDSAALGDLRPSIPITLDGIEVLDQDYNVIFDEDILTAGGAGTFINVGNLHNRNPIWVRFGPSKLGAVSGEGDFRYKTGAGLDNRYTTGLHSDSSYASQLTTSQSQLTGLYFDQGGYVSGHAINIDSATSGQEFTLTDCTFLNYASTSGNTGREAIINSSGQPISVLVSGTTNTPSVDSDGIRGKVTIINNIVTTLSGVLGNSEIKVLPTSGSPYSGNTLNDTLSIATETVSANTFTGDNTNYYQINTGGTFVTIDAVGSAVFSNFPGVLQDTNATNPRALADGDKIRVVVRDDADNPTLQLFDEFEVDADPTGPTTTSIITKTLSAGFTSAFGLAITGANSKKVTVEKVDARFQFSVSSGQVIDFLSYRVGSNPILTLGQTITSDNSSFPLSQVGDRNYRDPV